MNVFAINDGGNQAAAKKKIRFQIRRFRRLRFTDSFGEVVRVGMASIKARKALLTDSGDVNTSDTSASNATTRGVLSTRDANRFGLALE